MKYILILSMLCSTYCYGQDRTVELNGGLKVDTIPADTILESGWINIFDRDSELHYYNQITYQQNDSEYMSVYSTPSYNGKENTLNEHIWVEQNGKVLREWHNTVSTCTEYKEFRMDYPYFFIPKKIQIKFKCK